MAEQKKDGIKAHKERIERRERMLAQAQSGKGQKHRQSGRRAARPEERHLDEAGRRVQMGSDETRRRPEEMRSDGATRLPEGMSLEEARRRAEYRKKRKQKRKIQRMLLIAAFVVVILLAFFACRALVKGITGGTKGTEKKEAKASAVQVEQTAESKEATATITTAGDIVMHSPFFKSSQYKKGDTFDFNPIFQYIKDDYTAADFTVLTTEFSMTDGEYTGYPVFNSPSEIATTLADNGIDMCLLANNHIYDSGDEGLRQTLEVYEQNGLLYNGVRKNVDDKAYVVKEINGIKVGFFDYVYETENGTINGIAVSDESKKLLNSFQESNPQSLYDNIEKGLKEMEAEGVEYTIAYLHWGVEYQTKENEWQDAIAQKLCDMGVDALIASHPHVIQPVDLLTSTEGDHQMLCCYAIGNHLSNQRTEYMDGIVNGYSEDGLMVTLTIHRDKKGKIELQNADFLPTWVYHDKNADDKYYILPLDQPEELKKIPDVNDLSSDVQKSQERTAGIIGEGVQKVMDALPIVKK